MTNQTKPLTNAQRELIKAFAHELDNKEMEDFRNHISGYFENKAQKPKRKPGLAKGLISLSADFDGPIPDFQEYI